MVAVAVFHGHRSGVLEPDVVLLGVEETDHDDGRNIARAERRGQQRIGDSGDRVGGLQRGIELGGGGDMPELGFTLDC